MGTPRWGHPDGEPIRWLDVGCGFGELVAAVATLVPPGSDLRGIDPCEPKVRVARGHGLNVSAASLDEVGDGYDVVSLVNVFSHLPDPAAFLARLCTLLKPQGELVLVTGNGADVEAGDYPDPLLLPDHLVFAGERHLLELTRRLGFERPVVHRYPYFFRDPLWLYTAKAMAKRALGRPMTSRRNTGPFRSLFIRARLAGP